MILRGIRYPSGRTLPSAGHGACPHFWGRRA